MGEAFCARLFDMDIVFVKTGLQKKKKKKKKISLEVTGEEDDHGAGGDGATQLSLLGGVVMVALELALHILSRVVAGGFLRRRHSGLAFLPERSSLHHSNMYGNRDSPC